MGLVLEAAKGGRLPIHKFQPGYLELSLYVLPLRETVRKAGPQTGAFAAQSGTVDGIRATGRPAILSDDVISGQRLGAGRYTFPLKGKAKTGPYDQLVIDLCSHGGSSSFCCLHDSNDSYATGVSVEHVSTMGTPQTKFVVPPLIIVPTHDH